MQLINITGKITGQDARSHIDHIFRVDKPCKCLKIIFNYYPAYLENKAYSERLIRECFVKFTGSVNEEKVKNYIPLKNLLTLSVDSPKGCLGTAHRHQAKQEHIISAGKASRGFMPAEIIKGEWNVTVSVHSIITDNIDYYLSLEAYDDLLSF